ncbi:MAG: prepilin-type N-terminal cleavage/methylation domain-containing protein [Desulfobacteraceae bacterium]|jgi:prepilin-type N-terminal cleavage/methylation domain-containing protein
MLSKMRNREEGFTLIELMIVIAIIGILAAIAIPQFSAYRARSHNASANADLRNAITTQEAYYVDYQTYTDNRAALEDDNYGLVLSSGVDLSVMTGDSTTYTMKSFNNNAGERAVTYSINAANTTGIVATMPP